ncbi:MAG: CRTAC1 family protein [Gammaproteobacteria bacterium]|nr:CRTAC1 family protein [Gammaproteobacteria bacterium]
MAGVKRFTCMTALLSAVPWSYCSVAGDSATVATEFLKVAEELRDGDYQLADIHLESLERTLADPALTFVEQLNTRLSLSHQQMIRGEAEEAAGQIELIRGLVQRAIDSGAAWEEQRNFLFKRRGIAYMHLAEQVRCGVERGTGNCTVAPAWSLPEHHAQFYEVALRSFLEYLQHYPQDVSARWLANVSAHALDRHPDAVPGPLQINLFAPSKEPYVPRFDDVAPRLGIDAYDQAGGVMVEDFDGDGWLDIVTSTMDTFGSMRLFRSVGARRFEERTAGSGLEHQLGALNIVGADYDNDGDVDIYALRGAWMERYGRIRNSLLRNDGNGRFVDVTRSAGVEEHLPTQAAVWGDFDNDGHLDLYVGNESTAALAARSSLYSNRGDGTFVEVGQVAGVTNDRFAKAVATGDYDNDGDLDLYVSNRGVNRLYRNSGDGTFQDVATRARVTGPHYSFVSWFFDYDNDGWLDLFVNGYDGTVHDVARDVLGLDHGGTTPALYRNNGDGTFTDVARQMDLAHVYLAMGANFGDLDGDGFLDIYLGTGKPSYETAVPNAMLRNVGGRKFENVSVDGGFDRFEKGHGIAFNDIDHDGDMDVYHQLGGMFPGDRSGNALLLNPGMRGRFLKLVLNGTRSNRLGLGVRIRVDVETPSGQRAIHRAAGIVSGFGGSSVARQEIGLGDAERIARLVLWWPASDTRREYRNVPLDAMIAITEGEATFERLDHAPIRTDAMRPAS